MRNLYFTFFSFFSVITLFGQEEERKLEISQLTGNFYIYTTFSNYKDNKIPANGMYVVSEEGVILFDTPWDTTQFQPLLDSIKTRHNKDVVICIATHWHSDRTEGLEYYREKGVKTYTTVLTDSLSQKNNKKRAAYLMSKDTVFNVGEYSFGIYYPGWGHTEDNIIAWFENDKILYGGCLIKGAEAEDLGYLGDANIDKYEKTLKNVKNRCKDPKYIIVSHHSWKNIHSLEHSIKLAKKLRRNM